MGRSVALLFVVLLTAGCASIPGATTTSPAVKAPQLDAPQATLRLIGDTAFATWTGTVHPVERVPAPVPFLGEPADPTKTDAHVADHPFTMPTGVTFLEGWLNSTTQGATMSVLVFNDSGRRICGETFQGKLPAMCFATFYRPVASAKWNARVSIDALDGAAADVPYTLTLAFSARTLPILGSPVPYGVGAPTQFAPPVLVDKDHHTGEPSIALSPKGTVYVAAPTGAQESLWSSSDGKSFARVPIHSTPTDPGSSYPVGGGDSDVAVATDSTIYFADQQGGSGETVSASHDGGATWFTQPLGAGPAAIPGSPVPLPVQPPVGAPTGAVYSADRQWLVTDGDLNAWMGFNSAQGATVVQTRDGGHTWPVRALIDTDNCFRGNLARSPDGTLYLAGCNENGPGVAVSTNGGATFTYVQVAKRDGKTDTSFFFSAHIFVVVTTDAENNVYVVWSDEAQTPDASGAPSTGATGLNIWMASSKDHGASWSKPKKVNTVPGTFVQPWATAGKAGQLAIAYYGTKFQGNPERVMGEWYPIVAITSDALTDAPTFKESAISPDLVQYGPVCMRGSACGGQRNLLDFFQMQADSKGMLHVAYVDGRNGISARLSNIMYAGQTGGMGVGGKSVDKAAP